MWDGLKRQWCELRSAPPGRRFQERYERNRLARVQQSKVRRLVQLAIGVWLIKAGIILCFLPGPGIPLLVLGAAVLAERSLRMARALDWTEMKIRSFRKPRPATRNSNQ
jgi:hypothetical protein